MYTAILLSSQLTMLIPYGGASSVPPPTDGQTYKTCWSSAGCPTISCLILIILKVLLLMKRSSEEYFNSAFLALDTGLICFPPIPSSMLSKTCHHSRS
ncbi:hypothetical protein BDR07DRAFT_1412572 [Suillus spraguei]|nr:hypothetical protein BDR07DRAFT_1412572 [Suillus spraguei]